MSGWNAPVDIYCERLDASFWAEPLNAITNAAFLIAAFLAWREARRRGGPDPLLWAMIAAATVVGIGSFLFHTVATRWAGVADTTPILVFILLAVFAASWRFLGLPLWAALCAPPLFILFAAGFAAFWNATMPSINGSQGYLPALIALLGFGAALAARRHPAAGWLLAAGGAFILSLTFRSLDHSLCSALPIGVHFLWHVLNGVVLGLVMFAVARHGARRLAARPGQG